MTMILAGIVLIIGLFWALFLFIGNHAVSNGNQLFYLVPVAIAGIGGWHAIHKRLYSIGSAFIMYIVATLFWVITNQQILTIPAPFIVYSVLFFCIYPLLTHGFYQYNAPSHFPYTRRDLMIGGVAYGVATTGLLLLSGVIHIPTFPNTTNEITYILIVIALLFDAALIAYSLTTLSARWQDPNARQILLLFSIVFILWACADGTLALRQTLGISWPGDISDILYMLSLFTLTAMSIRTPLPAAAP